MSKSDLWNDVDSRLKEKQNVLQRKENKIKIIAIIILIISVFLFTFSISFALLRHEKTESAKSVIMYSAENSRLNVMFSEGDSFKIDNIQENKFFKSRNGNTVAAIDNNGIMNIMHDGKKCCEVNDVSTAVVSSNGMYVLYIKNANSVNSVFDDELVSGELIYYNVDENKAQIVTDEKGVKADVINKYIAISPSGEAFAYSCSYIEKNTDKETAEAEFKSIVVNKFGKKKEVLPNKNTAVLNISDDGNLVYWYEKLYNQRLDAELIITNSKKNINTPCGEIANENTKLFYNSDCSQLMIINMLSGMVSVYENALSTNSLYNNEITKLAGNDIVITSGVSSCENLFGQYYMTKDNSILYLDGKSKSFVSLISGREFFNIILSSDKKHLFFLEDDNLCCQKAGSGRLGDVSVIAENVGNYTVSADGRTVYFADKSGTVNCCNINGKIRFTAEDSIKSICFMVAGDYLYVIDMNNIIYGIDNDGKVNELFHAENEISDAYINEDGFYCVFKNGMYAVSMKENGEAEVMELF